MLAGTWLPVVFMALMGIAVLAYVILDGYDLGVGILLRRADDAEKDTMIEPSGVQSCPPMCCPLRSTSRMHVAFASPSGSVPYVSICCREPQP